MLLFTLHRSLKSAIYPRDAKETNKQSKTDKISRAGGLRSSQRTKYCISIEDNLFRDWDNLRYLLNVEHAKSVDTTG